MRSLYFALPALLTLLAVENSFAQCGSADLAAGRPATASSFDPNLFGFFGPEPPSNAFDANTSTFWASNGAGTQYIYVDLGATLSVCQVVLSWSTFGEGRNFNIATSNDASTWTTRITVTNNSSSTNTLPITGSGRYVRMQATSTLASEYMLFSMQVMGIPGCSSTNSALNKTVTASTTRSGFTPGDAVDGNANTAWRSSNSDNQTLTVDMGSVQSICSVGLTFDPANFGVDYSIQFANNSGGPFTTAGSISNNNSTSNTFATTGSARYVRFNGTNSSAGNGYAIDEITVSNPVVSLPIKLISFTATNINNQQVQLKWTTEMETNNKVFLIQRSGDGVTYTTIGQVPGAINSNTAIDYQWMDESPLKGTDYYRLEQVDLDGNSSFSNIQVVNIGLASANLSAYPNPVTDVLTIVNPKGLMIREVAVYNTSGMMLTKLAPASTGSVQVPTSNWAGGMYLVKVITNEGSQIIKVMK